MPEDVEMNDSAQPALAAAPAAADAPAPALSTLQHLQEIASVVEAGSLTKEVRRISRAVRPTVALRRRLAAPDVAAFLAFALPPSSEAFTRLSPLLPKEDGSEMDVDAAAPAAQVSIKHGLPEIEIYSQRQQLVSCEVFSEEKDGSVDGGGLKTKSCKRKIGIQVSPKEKTKKGREESSHKNLLQNLLVKKQQKYPVYRTRSEGEPDCKFWCIVEVHGQQFKSVNLHIRKKDAEQDAAKVAYDFLIARDGDSFEGVLALIDKGLLLGKTILYDFSCKKKICHPSYSCHRQEGPGRMTLFVTTVSVAGMEFTGVMAKSKNDAAERAACLAVKSILDTNDEVMLEIFRTKRRLLTAMPPSLLSACGLSVPAKHSPKKHKTNALGVSKDAYVEEPDEVQGTSSPSPGVESTSSPWTSAAAGTPRIAAPAGLLCNPVIYLSETWAEVAARAACAEWDGLLCNPVIFCQIWQKILNPVIYLSETWAPKLPPALRAPSGASSTAGIGLTFFGRSHGGEASFSCNGSNLQEQKTIHKA